MKIVLYFLVVYFTFNGVSGTCNDKDDCPPIKTCLSQYGQCICPVGMTGTNCDENVDSRCTATISLPISCTLETGGCNLGEIGDKCPDHHLCCGKGDGCSTDCIPIGCLVPANVKSCTDDGKLCQHTDTGFECICPFGYTGTSCETRTSKIDASCPDPNVVSVGSCGSGADETCDASLTNICPEGHICCSTGCGTACIADPSLACVSTSMSCSGNKVCYSVGTENLCLCPEGFGGVNCMDRESIDTRCPFPSSLADVCSFDASPCSGCGSSEICCLSDNACSTQCIMTGCKNPGERKVCTDMGKLCMDDESQPDGIKCFCPLGYTGDDCDDRMEGIDSKCKKPKVTNDICTEIKDPPSCSSNDDCENDQICCSTGCDQECMDPPPKDKPGISNLALLLLLSSRRQPKPRQRIPQPPMCMRSCQGMVCAKNVGAKCGRYYNTGCFVFYDQHTNHIIPDCQCSRNQIFWNCPDYCYSSQCVNPNARCRTTRCGRCEVYWIDITTGREERSCRRRYSP